MYYFSASPMGDAATTFSREGFGRQSMSEKRRAHMDPSHSEVYQKIKHLRDSNRGTLKALVKAIAFMWWCVLDNSQKQ